MKIVQTLQSWGAGLVLLLAWPLGPAGQSFEDYTETLAGSSESISMVAVKGGVFRMGSARGVQAESPVHKVKVDDFWIGAYEISWAQYEAFASRRIDAVSPGKDSVVVLEPDAVASATTPYVDMSHGMGKKNRPVVNVTQYAALMFCKWLSAKTGRFYRLPTEAEWEYACRAGSEKAYSFGDDPDSLPQHAWYQENSPDGYQPVGLKAPNDFGLYDMHGNVAEWTMDQYDPHAYASRAKQLTENPWVQPTQLYPGVVRGGSWQDGSGELHAAARTPSEAAWKRIDPQIPKSRWWFTNAPHVGFRIVRPRVSPSPQGMEKYWLEAMDDY